jgi:DNA-binding LytR/AlgR family response regulator
MKFFFARVNGKYQIIFIKDIRFIEAKKNYVRIVTENKSYLVHLTLGEIEKQLPENIFCKIHRSYIIAISKLVSFDYEHAYLKDIDLPISASFFESLKKKIFIIGPDRGYKAKNRSSKNVGFGGLPQAS